MKKVLVIGASTNPDRYSNRCVKQLNSYGHSVFALGLKPGLIDSTKIETEFPHEEMDTITMYVGAKRQPQYYDSILSSKPKRIIFNPGAENYELSELASKAGIQVENACTLVMLSIGNF